MEFNSVSIINRGSGACEILGGVQENFGIKILNLGWNNIGNFQSKVFADKLAIILKDDNIIHLDISHNNLNKDCCQMISQGLMNNHSLYGIHVEGNECMIDPKGFMTDLTDITCSEMHLINKLSIAKSKLVKVSKQNHCWLCEGWSEINFSVNSNGNSTVPMYIHLSFFNFEPKLMEYKGKYWIFWAMCPPGEVMFFYSQAGVPILGAGNKKKMHVEIKNALINETYISLKVDEVNYLSASINHDIINENLQIKIEHCFPRMKDGKFDKVANLPKVKPPWSIPISIFKDYRVDNESLLNKCFEFDWSCCKLPKLGDEEQQVKEAMRKGYKLIKENYKILSAIGKVGNKFGINWLTYNDFVLYKIKIVDGVDIKLNASDLLFRTINGREKQGSSLSLYRAEFMEALLRLALQRYYDTQRVKTREEAINKLIEDHLYKHTGDLNSQKWRDERYWNEECDNIYKANWSLIEHLYLTMGGHARMPSEKW